MSIEFVQVTDIDTEEAIELPIEDDGTLLLSTVAAQFPGCCGLRYQPVGSKNERGVRLSNGRLYAPPEGWSPYLVYFCSFPKENYKKNYYNVESSMYKPKHSDNRISCSDLIVLGLPWKATELTIREYFEKFGEVLMVQLKKDPKTGMSKGFAFIRFASYTSQLRALAQRHMISGRWCDVRIPNSKEGSVAAMPCKVFVGRCTEDLSADDLKDYFLQFGEVMDVFIPKPFRAFSFVTFLDPEVAQSLCGQDHIIKGISVNVSNASPKQNKVFNQRVFPSNMRGETSMYSLHGNNDGLRLSQRSIMNNGSIPNQNSMSLNMGGIPMNRALFPAPLNPGAWGVMSGVVPGSPEHGDARAGAPDPNALPGSNFLSWMQQTSQIQSGMGPIHQQGPTA